MTVDISNVYMQRLQGAPKGAPGLRIGHICLALSNQILREMHTWQSVERWLHASKIRNIQIDSSVMHIVSLVGTSRNKELDILLLNIKSSIYT